MANSHVKVPNTRIHSDYRRSNTSSHSSTKPSKAAKNLSKASGSKAEDLINNMKSGTKNRKSVRKLKARGPSQQIQQVCFDGLFYTEFIIFKINIS